MLRDTLMNTYLCNMHAWVIGLHIFVMAYLQVFIQSVQRFVKAFHVWSSLSGVARPVIMAGQRQVISHIIKGNQNIVVRATFSEL